MLTVIMVLCAVFLDYLLGEPTRYHPLTFYGRLVARLEKRFYPPRERSPNHFLLAGLLAWLILVVPLIIPAIWLSNLPLIGIIVSVIGLYVALGGQSLAEHAQTVQSALEADNLRYARERLGMMVNHDIRELDEAGVCRVAIESVLENGNNAIFATIFWFALLGLPGVVLYRLAYALDAMWGFKNERYLYFGRAATQVMDILNWLPARMTALTYVLIGRVWRYFPTWVAQARQWKGNNAGWLLACGAGGMGLKLGGPVRYHGHEEVRPWLGMGRVPIVDDINQSIRFLQQGLWLWLVILFLGGWLMA